MIFPVLETEKVVQIGDMTRISAVKSFVSKGEIEPVLVEICPETQEDPEDNEWIEVTGSSSKDWYLDWVYTGDTRAAVPAVRVTTVEADPEGDPDPIEAVYQEIEGAISLLSVDDDNLFSKDQDLIALEPDILKWVSEGRASFLNVHRAAQAKIFEALDESGVVDSEGDKLTKSAAVDPTELMPWSRDLALHLIFNSLSNAVDDVFSVKAKHYGIETNKRKSRAIIRVDTNGDGQIDNGEGVASMKTVDLVRR